MTKFDADTLRALRDVQEPTIRTDKHPKSAVVIWVVVDGDEVFVRSWLGARGVGTRISRRAAPPRWSSPATGCRCRRSRRTTPTRSNGPAAKSCGNTSSSSHAQEMVRAEILPTTLRLEPR